MLRISARPKSSIRKVHDGPTRRINSHIQDSHRCRYLADAWNCLRGQIDREHHSIAAADPHSPRIRPTLALFALVEGRG
jgi:hypothetical protein